MLREPSQRVIHPVDDGGNVGESDDDQEESDSSSSEETDDDDNSSATETEEIPTRYGTSRGAGSLSAVGGRGLLGKARRESSSHASSSIAEEGEDEGKLHPAQFRSDRPLILVPHTPGRGSRSTTMESRQVSKPALGQLPAVPTPSRQTSSSVWGLPTPKTPGPNVGGMNWGFSSPTASSGATGWTHFGSSTPGVDTPVTISSQTTSKPALSAYSIPAGITAAAAMAKVKGSEATAVPSRSPAGGYFDDVATPQVVRKEDPLKASEAVASTGLQSPVQEMPNVNAQTISANDAKLSTDLTTSSGQPSVSAAAPNTREAGFIGTTAEGDQTIDHPSSPSVELPEEELSLAQPLDSDLANPNASLAGALPPPPTAGSIMQSPPAPTVSDYLSRESPTQSELEGGVFQNDVAQVTDNVASISIPTEASNLPQSESPGSEDRDDDIVPVMPATTNTTDRPAIYSRVSHSAIDLLSGNQDQTDSRVDPTFAAAVRERMNPGGVASGFTSTTSFDTNSTTSDLSSQRPSPARIPSSADWALPPPTPGIGMKQPFDFSSTAGSPRMQSIKKADQPSPSRSSQRDGIIKRRRSLHDISDVAPPEYVYPLGVAQAVIKPREEEGREPLPDYWCSVSIAMHFPFRHPTLYAGDY